MELKLTNTLTRRKEVFVPLRPGRAGIYTCGPTVYADAHIGNLRSYLFPDILKKTLRRLGYQVTHVMNITDVGHLTSNEDTGEDKMERAARSAGRSAWEIAAEHTERFLRDLERLNIELPDVLPRAAGDIPPELLERVRAISPRYAAAPGHIQEQIDLVRTLEAKGVAYRTEDGIYFDTSRFPHYGQLARIHAEGLQEGARVEMGGKRHKTDFALWKFSLPDAKRQMEWDSPWGRGFPGWHIECSAMSMKYLGESFDIHTGGSDHIPVHHTNEIAQSECATGHPFVRYWLHGEFLVLGEDQRMGKSEGNLVTVQDLIDRGFSPMAFRYLVLNTHYRKFLNFSTEAMEGARTALMELRRLVHGEVNKSQELMNVIREMMGEKQDKPAPRNKSEELLRLLREAEPKLFVEAVQNRVLESLCDDLNTPQALATLWTALRDSQIEREDRIQIAIAAEEIFSLNLFDFTHLYSSSTSPPEIQALASARWSARQRRDFKESDRLRDELLSQGWIVRDRKDGYDVVPAGS